VPGSDPPNVFPTLRYRDAPAAIEWLVRVLRFEVHAVHEGPDGSIAHAELQLGNGMVMLGSYRPADEGASAQAPGHASVYIAIDDPDALHDHAEGAGAEIARELTNTEYGSRDFAVRDLEGNVWNFGTYNPFTPPA
jgi:uncharacterized glyoxalase superfamily protein PhnB